jgi:hypothetical protein
LSTGRQEEMGLVMGGSLESIKWDGGFSGPK